MERLLARGSYNSGKRPSEHTIGEKSFLKKNAGAIPPNVIDIDPEEPNIHNLFNTFQMGDYGENFLEYANTESSGAYRTFCTEHGIVPHPAVMNERLAEFFIRLLTDEGDLVYDPFGGSNTTGASAQKLKRNWIITEKNQDEKGQPLDFLEGSKGRFESDQMRPTEQSEMKLF